tara:strand:- start:346 stop:543 length:198 start_codon:yes stop_codon:yes gene_type:complete
MITKPELIEIIIKEYDKLINIYSQYLDAYEYDNQELKLQEGRVKAFKECLLGQRITINKEDDTNL